jgi:DNA-binding HxlR family transcriptional regulator
MAYDEISELVAGQDACPIDPVLGFLALKWLVHIVWLLGRERSLRFAELQRRVPGRLSAKVLSGRLKQLEKLGIVEREDKGTKPPHVTYRLTSYGRAVDGFLTGLERQARKLPLPGLSPLSTKPPT